MEQRGEEKAQRGALRRRSGGIESATVGKEIATEGVSIWGHIQTRIEMAIRVKQIYRHILFRSSASSKNRRRN